MSSTSHHQPAAPDGGAPDVCLIVFGNRDLLGQIVERLPLEALARVALRISRLFRDAARKKITEGGYWERIRPLIWTNSSLSG